MAQWRFHRGDAVGLALGQKECAGAAGGRARYRYLSR